MQHPGGTLQIHEYYYDGVAGDGWTQNGIAPQGEDIDQLRTELERMLKCLGKPVLDYETGKEVWK